jgi:hypothetical protein
MKLRIVNLLYFAFDTFTHVVKITVVTQQQQRDRVRFAQPS